MYSSFSRALGSLLLLAVYVLGSCVACEQVIAKSAGSAHCCTKRCKKTDGKPTDPAGQNKTQDADDCQAMPFEAQSSVHAATDSGIRFSRVLVFWPERSQAQTTTSVRVSAKMDTVLLSPADLTLLNASFLI